MENPGGGGRDGGGDEGPSTLRVEKVGTSILATVVTWRLPDSGGGEGRRRRRGGGCLSQGGLVGSCPLISASSCSCATMAATLARNWCWSRS